MKKYITNSKIFYHAKEFASYQDGNDFNPISIELHISNACNNFCYYCGMGQVKDSHIMKWSKIEKSIKFVKDVGAKSIYFSGGGEPTCNKDYPGALSLAHNNGLDVGLITNGINIKADCIISFCKWVRISLDSSNGELYEKIRGIDRYKEVKDNIINLINAKKKTKSDCTIGLRVIPNKYNYTKIYSIVCSLLTQFKGIDYIQIRPIESKWHKNPYSSFQMRLINLQLKRLNKINGVIISDKWGLYGNNGKFGFNICHSSSFTGTIDAHGNYYICCHTINNENYQIANIFHIKQIDDFNIKYNRKLFFLGKHRGFNPGICPVGCRGSIINKSITQITDDPHRNFI